MAPYSAPDEGSPRILSSPHPPARVFVAETCGRHAILPFGERSPSDHGPLQPGDRVPALVIEVTGERVTLSQAHPGFVARLLEREVPEIRDGTVRIEAIAREPGRETKIALSSDDADLDAIGVCTGDRGSRVLAVTAWVPNELVSFLDWHPAPAQFVAHALAPTRVHKVYQDDDAQMLELVIADEDLPRVLAHRAAPLRMAAQLVGWRLDLLTLGRLEEFRADLARVQELDAQQVSTLLAYGVRSVESLLEYDADWIAEVLEIEAGQAAGVIAGAAAHTV